MKAVYADDIAMSSQENDLSLEEIEELYRDCGEFIQSTASEIMAEMRKNPEKFTEAERLAYSNVLDSFASFSSENEISGIFTSNRSGEDDSDHMIDRINAVNNVMPLIQKILSSRRSSAHLTSRLARMASRTGKGKGGLRSAKVLALRFKGIGIENIGAVSQKYLELLEQQNFGEEAEADIGFSRSSKNRDEDGDEDEDGEGAEEDEKFHFPPISLFDNS